MHTTSPSTTTRSRRRLATLTAAAAGLVTIGSLAATTGAAHATNEFPAKPSLSIITECKAGVYYMHIGMYNIKGASGTTFHVTASNASGPPLGTTDYFLGPQVDNTVPLLWLDYVVAEGVTGSFHVVNNDDPQHPIDETRTPRADCIADPVVAVKVTCADDDSATLRYDYVNTSYAQADFALLRDGAQISASTLVWQDHDKFLVVPVSEGEHVNAAITVDGASLASLDTVVDCVPEPETTIPETTIPETTIPETTIPETTIPETTIPVTIPETTIPATTMPEPVTISTVPQVEVLVPQAPPTTTVRLEAPADAILPSTGSSSTGTSVAAIALLLAGFGLVRTARRRA